MNKRPPSTYTPQASDSDWPGLYELGPEPLDRTRCKDRQADELRLEALQCAIDELKNAALDQQLQDQWAQDEEEQSRDL